MNIYTRTFFILGLVGWWIFASYSSSTASDFGREPGGGWHTWLAYMVTGIFGLVGAIAYKVLDRK